METDDWTSVEWATWVREQVDKREKVYRTDPDELISAYNREVSNTSDYHGRELLELLQNADDAGVEFEQPNKVAIVLTNEGLCVANTGKPFSDGGIKSLMVSDNSPKKNDRSRYIGNKGLGFRSILSWTDCPFILSGSLSIGFDSSRAQSWLEALCLEDRALQQRVRTQTEIQGIQRLVPTLAIPALLDASGETNGSVPDAENFRPIWKQSQKLRADGYNTVIAIPFITASAFQDVEAQLNEIGQEFLLFTKHLSSLTIERPSGMNAWNVERADDSVEITPNGMRPQIWQVFENSGEIPEYLLHEDLKMTPGYEIKIAVPLDEVKTPGFLFNYFQTQIRFAYPLFAHVTFEMIANRQHIRDNESNRYLVQKMAELLAQVAEASASVPDPWRALSLVTTTEPLDPALEKMGFRQFLYSAVQKCEIVPVRSGRLVRPCEAKRLKVLAGDWLPASYFQDVVQWTDDAVLDQMLQSLGVKLLDEYDFCTRLNQASAALTLLQRAALLVGLAKSKMMPQKPAPNLLIDQNNDVISSLYQVFLPPEGDDLVPLPTWMSLRMLNSNLSKALRQQFGGGVRDLTGHLNAYNINEYSLQALTQAIVARANEGVRDEPGQENSYRHEAFQAIYHLFKTSNAFGELPRPPLTNVYTLNAAGVFAPANTLYLSYEYPNGKLTEALYGSIGRHLLVASPAMMQLDGEDVKIIESCLRWLGVAAMPRSIQKNSSASHKSQEFLCQEYQDYVKSHLKYPAKTSHPGEDFTNPSQLDRAVFSKVQSVDQIEALIIRATPDALLAWVALDDRVEAWRRQGDASATVEAIPFGKSKPRVIEQPKPSYVIWLLERRPWLPSSKGIGQPPNRCVLASLLADDLKNILPRPSQTSESPFFQELAVDAISFRNALQRVGVRQSLEEFSQDEVYQLLLDMPSLDPDGKCAKSLYRTLISRPEETSKPDCIIKSKFLREGKLWGTSGDASSYFPVNQLYYISTNVVPQVVVRTTAHLSLDKKQGHQKVKNVFGVQSLDNNKWKVEIKSSISVPDAGNFSRNIEALKPFIYALRLHSDSSADGLRRLKNLRVNLSSHVEGVAIVAGTEQFFELKEKGEFVSTENVFYLYSDTLLLEDTSSDVVLMDAVGEIFAEVLGVEQSSDFARLASVAPAQRIVLLERLIGATRPETTDRLKEAEAKLGTKLDAKIASNHGPVYVPATAPNPPASEPASVKFSNVLNKDTDAVNDGSEAIKPIQSVSVEQRKHVPSAPGHKIELRVQATPLGTHLPRNEAMVTNAARCEEVTARFEEAQGRFSLPVSQVKGLRGYGCDVLSFGTRERLDQFTSQPDSPDVRLVERFIEVKGKSRDTATIELRGNELGAATKHGRKFYLYRVYEETPGEFSILILANPLSATINTIYEVNLLQQEKTERFWATEMLSP